MIVEIVDPMPKRKDEETYPTRGGGKGACGYRRS